MCSSSGGDSGVCKSMYVWGFIFHGHKMFELSVTWLTQRVGEIKSSSTIFQLWMSFVSVFITTCLFWRPLHVWNFLAPHKLVKYV